MEKESAEGRAPSSSGPAVGLSGGSPLSRGRSSTIVPLLELFYVCPHLPPAPPLPTSDAHIYLSPPSTWTRTKRCS